MAGCNFISIIVISCNHFFQKQRSDLRKLNNVFVDLDECRHNPCGAGSQCTNTKGGYTCSCPRGYQGNPTPEAGCVDIDECWGPKPPCGKGAQCVNTNGGYYCQCPEGYTGNPTSGCVGKLK